MAANLQSWLFAVNPLSFSQHQAATVAIVKTVRNFHMIDLRTLQYAITSRSLVAKSLHAETWPRRAATIKAVSPQESQKKRWGWGLEIQGPPNPTLSKEGDREQLSVACSITTSTMAASCDYAMPRSFFKKKPKHRKLRILNMIYKDQHACFMPLGDQYLWRHPASLCIILRADISSHRCRLVTPAVTRFSQLRSQLQLLTEPWAGSQYHTTIWNSPASLLSHHGSSWSIFGHQIFRLRSFPDFAYMYVQL